jgi:hypothetical protein
MINKKIGNNIRNLPKNVIRFFKDYHDIIELFLTAIAIWVAYVLYTETTEQVKIARDAFEHQRINDSSNSVDQRKRDSASFVMSDSSLKLTRQSNQTIQENFIVENRAWVGVEYSNSFPMYDLSLRIKNFGKTAAENVRWGDTAFPCNTIPAKRPHVTYTKPTAMSPDGTNNIDIPLNLPTGNTVPDVLSQGKTGVCYYGIITYSDIYNRTDTTEFMYFLNGGTLTRIGTNRMK